ncbi:hypothetical protein AVEN_222983-1 [Araneus ventricosus]|uniref:Uncharacterized protein n=1 Tax=Araneus ventricosus TaxID=182803 RepID=A0A4Y2K7T4_ARAVE|nr:hypothetical protein AVEN_222983-1 [Araneus ventricosus]
MCETRKVRAVKHVHHSSDLTQSDFHLFGPMKKRLVGRHFRTNAEVQEVFVKWLRDLGLDFFYAGIDRLVYRWHKYFNNRGDYAEK